MDVKYLVVCIVAFAVAFLLMGVSAYIGYWKEQRIPAEWSQKDRDAVRALCRIHHLAWSASIAREKDGRLFVCEGGAKRLQLEATNFPTIPRGMDVPMVAILKETRILHWRPEERALAQSLRTALPGEEAALERTPSGDLILHGGDGSTIAIDARQFLTLLPGNVIRLVDIPDA